MPRVSIIMAAYNSEQYIKEAIESIIKQTITDWELIICDDNSDDSTYKIVTEFTDIDSRIKIIRNEENKKAAYSRNRCIDIAKGRFIAVQDADDISMPDRLEKQLYYLNRNKDIDFVGSRSSSFDENGVWRTTDPISYPKKKDFLKGSPFTHASIMFRQETINAVGGYRVSKETVRGQDTDMIMKMYAKGFKGANQQEVLYMYREDMSAINRRSLRFRLHATSRNIKRFRELDLMPLGYFYAIKPILAGLVPKNIYFKIKKLRK